MYKPKAASIYLNRVCPRKCPYCNVVDPVKEKGRLTVEHWKDAFLILRDELGIEFFLVLGTEPLLMENDLTELIKFWKKEDIEYGLYSTAPRGLFQRSISRLLNAGLRNWSCGIDFIPEVYETLKHKISFKAQDLILSQEEELVKKSEDSLYSLKYLEGKVEELHAMPTISRMNIEFMPEMIMWLVDNFDKSLHLALNFVESSNDKTMDFADNKGDPFFFHNISEDKYLLREFSEKMHYLPDKYKSRIQTSIDYVDNYEHILNLDWKCKLNCMSISIDCNGVIRQCGYKDAPKIVRWNVFDIPNCKDKILNYLEQLHFDCKGCYWSYPYALERYGVDIVDYRSKLWKKRNKEEKV